jgi:hypothetical protein
MMNSWQYRAGLLTDWQIEEKPFESLITLKHNAPVGNCIFSRLERLDALHKLRGDRYFEGSEWRAGYDNAWDDLDILLTISWGPG